MSIIKTGLGSIVFGLYLLLIFSLGSMKPTIDVGFAEITPTDLIFPIVALCWLAAIIAGSCRFRWRFEFSIFAFYLATLTISSVFSANPRLSFTRLLGVVYLTLLAAIGASVVLTLDRVRISILFWLAGSVLPLLAALIGIFLFYFFPGSPIIADLTYHYGAVPVGNFPRISSTFVSASMFCNYLTATLVLAMLAIKMEWITRRIAATIILVVGVCALSTVSIALGGIALAVGLWIWVTNSKRPIGLASMIFGCVIAIAFLAIAPFALLNRGSATFFGRLEPSSRFLVWSDALRTFFADPLTGNGLGTAVANVTFHNYDGTWSLLTDAHNSFLNVAAQAGILGLVGIVGITVTTMRSTLSTSANEDRNYILLGLGIAFFTAFVYEGLTGSFEEARHLWVLMGLILAAKKIREPHGSGALHSA